jgi:L-glyceraldehyde 3-phosphate reductase
MSKYQPSAFRYQSMSYRRSGKSGLVFPALSLGLWHNFGYVNVFENSRNLIRTAFDHGITHFDLANNYGPPPGSAESVFGEILKLDFRSYRNEMIISTKAGYTMWDGPYGDWGSKKYLVSSLDSSLQRMKLDYVDIFYHHRPDPGTPIEETMQSLDLIVRQGKALYVGLSNYTADQTAEALAILKQLGTPCLIHQPKYSLFERGPESELLNLLEDRGVGCIAFSPLAQGLLTDKYLNGIPADSRVMTSGQFLKESNITTGKIEKVRLLNEIAQNRGQKLVHMALSWILKYPVVTSVLIGASRPEQITDALLCLENLTFSDEELKAIDMALSNE